MFYREAGQFKTNYADDQALLPILQDRIGIGLILIVAFVVVPVFATEFFLSSIMIPFLVFALAAIGLNILTGYAGQLSLGTGAFMGVGAYACYKLTTYFPDVSIIVHIMLSGLFSAMVGVLFGLPSLRIKGLYLAITTLAAQFFLEWCFIRVGWLYNYNDSGAIEVPLRELFGIAVAGPQATPIARYLVILTIVALMTLVAANVLRGRIGRSWMMIRDMDIAAELMGVRPLRAKLSAFAFSSYYCGVAGALMVFCWLGSAEVEAFDINHSFLVLFMVIIGGMGSLLGCFLGAAFIWVLPVIIRFVPPLLGLDVLAATLEHVSQIIIGVLIVFFLIVEPHGLARMWQIVKEKLRTWPFPYATS
ncbi:MAG: branched-chain amino acid ABC transporter permease [Gammaproteobacteria bacterium]|nr:branched-chain amino acid ABC transporter permease [Gammaproteobacteria bacterium]